ncbi:MAG: WD40 repeat domain-containing protein [Pirellulales bacterium]|nr:WD40 repeat domain-containing protein [Pirellulales bacterium]
MKIHSFVLAGLSLAMVMGTVARLSAESITRRTPVQTIDLGATRPAEKTPVVSSVALSPTGRQIATAGDDHLVRIWDFEQGKVLRRLAGHGDWVRAVAFSPDGRLLATACDDRRVRVWDLSAQSPLHSIATPKMVTRTLAFSPDGRRLAAGGFGSEIVLIRMADGQIERKLESPGGDVRVLAFSPDGEQLAAAGRTGTIRLWSSKEHVRDLVGHRRRVRAMAYSPDGTRLASAGDEREVRLWDTATGNHLATLPKQSSKLLALTFCSADILAAGGSDNVIRIWNTRNALEAFSLEGHTGSVTALAWKPDTQTLFSGSFDTTVRVWQLNDDTIDRVSQQRPSVPLGK